MSEAQIPVQIQILKKTYKLKVSASSEEILRARVKLLNETASNLQANFRGLEEFDYLAMSIVQVLATLEQNTAEVDTKYIEDQLVKIADKLKA